jgi:hypothetical protein
MKALFKIIASIFVSFMLGISIASADNQTADLSPITPGSVLPFQVQIQQANFELPVGIHSGVMGTYKGQWIFIAGRINGMHGFGGDPFPPDEQNTSIYVVNPTTGVTISRSLYDPSSGLNQQQIDSLSVTSPQGYQESNTLYMTGGYGIDTATATFGTKSLLTALYLPGIVDWVAHKKGQSVVKNMRQLSNPLFQVTGGDMFNVGGVTQLIFGQNFDGVYTPSGNGNYTEQVRQFKIKNNGAQLAVDILPTKPLLPDPNFRRRDLNIVPTLLQRNNQLQYGLIAYAGVFTLTQGVWTVPVVIDQSGNPSMADPNAPTTFKQGMNQYVTATASLYSKSSMNMYHIFFGGISYGFFTNGVFQTDSEIPFINQVTTVQMDKNGNFTQYLMANQYPTILSTRSNPGNTLLFGAGAYFIVNRISQYNNTVINLDNIRQPTVIGYIAGGIQSTVPNTNVITDSSASPYVFTVTLVPRK